MSSAQIKESVMKVVVKPRKGDTVARDIETDKLLIDQQHGLFRNIRGVIGVTTDLQQSLPKDGQIKRIQVIPHPSEPDLYLVLDGNRRVTAARKAGIEVMKAEVLGVPIEEATKFMLLSTMRQDIPDVALDSDGNVIGGYCYAVHDLIDNHGAKRAEVARLTGQKPDTISALRDLYHEELVDVRRAVANGRMAITVYWRLRRLSNEEKREILSLKGQITRKKIEKFLQDRNDEIAAAMAEAEIAEQAQGLDILFEEGPQDLIPDPEEEYPISISPVQSKFEFVGSRYGVEQGQSGLLMEALSILKRASRMEWQRDSAHPLGEIRQLVQEEW
jgi:hypothetical protein